MKIPKKKNCGKFQNKNILSFLSSDKLIICFRPGATGETLEKLLSDGSSQWKTMMKAVDINIPMRFHKEWYKQAELFKKSIGLHEIGINYTVVHWYCNNNNIYNNNNNIYNNNNTITITIIIQ